MTEEEMGVNNTEQVSSLKERLQSVANEIDSIKNTFTKSTENLTKVQSMLDVGNFDEIGTIIEKFEGQLSEAEKKKEEAIDGAKKYSEELEKEKERLIKLWDAYKNQEEELSTTESRIAEFEERAKVAETSKKQLEEDMGARINTLSQKLEENEGKIKQFDEYKQRCEDFDGIRNRLEEEIRNLKDEADNKENSIKTLENQLESLKEFEKFSEYKEKYDEVAQSYEKEKERLTKLYHLYEETETECNRLREEVKTWESWFNSNKEVFDKLFATPPGIIPKPKDHPEPPKNPIKKSKSKKKRKIGFNK